MRVKVGDGRLFFDVEGAKLAPQGPAMAERPTLLLLHGGPGFDHSGYKPQFSALSDVAQIIYLDHRSNGRSDRTGPERWTLDNWGDDVRAFCDALEIEKPIVLGTSFGGFVAMNYATRYPEHPGKLILCTTAARVRFERVLETFERLGGPEARTVAQKFFDDPSPDHMARYMKTCMPLYTRKPTSPEMLARTIFNTELTTYFFEHNFKSLDLLPSLGRIKCPTLVLGGEDDPITPIADSADIAAAIPRELVRFERFANAGHRIAPDAPERFFAILREFIAA